MAREIERKFLIHKDHPGFSQALEVAPMQIRQGYISSDPERTIRVRQLGNQGFLTIKGPKVGIEGDEFEYEIPLKDAQSMLDTMCETSLEKERRFIPLAAGLTIELDYFPAIDLHLAEVELPTIETEFVRPDWFAEEVSEDPEYFNSRIAERLSKQS